MRTTRFEELDWEPTALGDISLRRRWDPLVRQDIYEVKLGDEFLMSSLFTVAEHELARLALALCGGEGLDVLVGGLGLGYTAKEVLAEARVGSLLVVEALEPVIRWHDQDLVPASGALLADPRYRATAGDFFALTSSENGYDPGSAHRTFDAILVDIDHSPRHVLARSNAGFYSAPGAASILRHLKPDGIFALWSNDPPDDEYLEVLRTCFTDVRAEIVRFPNPLQDRDATNTVYLARKA